VSIYSITSVVYRGEDEVAYVQCLHQLSYEPLKLWHNEPDDWSLSVMIMKTRKNIEVSVHFYDIELDYIYNVNETSEVPFTLDMPLYFKYPFTVEKPIRMTLHVDELRQLMFPGFKTLTY